MSKWKVIYWYDAELKIMFIECSSINLSAVLPIQVLNGLVRIDRVPNE